MNSIEYKIDLPYDNETYLFYFNNIKNYLMYLYNHFPPLFFTVETSFIISVITIFGARCTSQPIIFIKSKRIMMCIILSNIGIRDKMLLY